MAYTPAFRGIKWVYLFVNEKGLSFTPSVSYSFFALHRRHFTCFHHSVLINPYYKPHDLFLNFAWIRVRTGAVRECCGV